METFTYGQEQVAPPSAEGLVLQKTYRLVRQIGFGGMGVVYEATHSRLPSRFAVKVLLRSLMVYPEAFARFAREAAIMSELRHPHVVQIVDFNVTDEQQPYFVMEYLDGHDLDAELMRHGPMAPAKVVAIVEAIASALGSAHRRGIVHRDLKPSNVFLCTVDGSDEPFVKVLDFGVSMVRSAGRITNNSEMVGTPHYMAPEQATGRVEQVDGRADQFSLAAMAYEMLTGQDAFAGDDPVAVLYQIVHQDPQPLSRHVPWDCAGVEGVLRRGLAKDPAQRYRTITEFARALAEAARDARVGQARLNQSDEIGSGVGHTGVSHSADVEVEVSESDLRVPRSPYRAVVLMLIALALVGTVVAKGWARELPDDVLITYRSLADRLTGQPALAQPDRSGGPLAPPTTMSTTAPAPALPSPPPAPTPVN
jgi:serine/threonine protein kinase